MSVNGDLPSRLKGVFQNVFHELPPEEAIRITRLDAKYWDSEAHLFLIVSLEEEFGVTIGDFEGLEITSLDSAREMLLEKLGV